MTSLADHPSTSTVKLLTIGESGTGKTGALASLAKAGYSLYILDYDNGLDILRSVLRDDPKALARVQYALFRDTITSVNGIPKIKSPVTAYKSAGKQLQEWNLESLGPDSILVLDTLTTFSEAAFNEALSLAGRLNQRPQLQDYGWMADSVKLFIELITSPEIKCNLIVNTHIRFFSGSDEDQTQSRGLPNAKGQEISRIISRYFNTVILTRTQGSGPGAKRVITTQPQGVVEVKTSAPSHVKPSYPIETGLASLFADITGGPPPVTPPASKTPATSNAN